MRRVLCISLCFFISSCACKSCAHADVVNTKDCGKVLQVLFLFFSLDERRKTGCHYRNVQMGMSLYKHASLSGIDSF